MNFQQHCNSKKHLRKTASAGTAAIPEVGSPGSGEENDGPQALNPTYVGLQAQCRNYCKQVQVSPGFSALSTTCRSCCWRLLKLSFNLVFSFCSSNEGYNITADQHMSH